MLVSSKFIKFVFQNTNILNYSSGADSLAYLSVDGLEEAVKLNRQTKGKREQSGYCTACLTGEYPGGVPEDLEW